MDQPTPYSCIGDTDKSLDFAPADLTDYRPPGDWRSRYDPEAKRNIRLEAAYLLFLIIAAPALMLSLWLDWPKCLFAICEQKYAPIQKYGIAWLAGC